MGKGSNDALAEKFHIDNIMKTVDSSTSLEVLNHVNEAIVRRSQSQRIDELQQSSKKGKFVHAIKSFVERYGGSNPITSILISNNGLAAVKFIRSIRQFSLKNLGDERAISLVAMATPEDMRVGAEHIRMADQIVEVPGGSNNNNYANVRLIVEVAQRVGVDAVWPGWGHASEYPDLPAALKAAGIIFLGPPAEPMAALGDKVGSTILAQAANVPTLAWSGSEISVSYEECNGVIPEDIYKKACINDPEEAAEVCEKIGYPVMLKASWGGGGKGIRKVFDGKNVKQIFKQVQAEVPGSPIFAMRLAPKSRHLEVQLLADVHGNVCSLFSRDCSVQRRHQKIVEEGPVTIAPPEELRKMEVAACNLARSVGYVGAATVEYLYLLETGQVCFLELNPRLQVEHPVTEWISGVNIPSCQLMIGMGIPLWRIPDIRRMYKASPNEDSFIDLSKEETGSPSGHVVAVRITSEDAEDGFKPTSGSIDELSFRSTPDVWGYFSVKGGGGVHEYADSQFGHLFAKGETRTEAIKHMLVALADIKIRGEIRTTVDYLMDMLQSEGFVNNLVSTSWLDERIEKQVKPESPTWYLAVIGAGVSRAYQVLQGRMADFISYLEKGQIPGRNTLLEAVHHSVVLEGTKYQIEVAKVGPQTYKVSLNGSSVFVVARALRDGGLLMQLDGNSYVVHAEEQPLGTRLLIGQKTCMIEKERDPSKVVAVTPGKLIRWLVEDKSHVEADEQYAEIEVMKMIMPLVSPAAGIISLEIAEGQQVTPGQLIARIKLDDESSIKIAKLYTGHFPSMGPPIIVGESSDQRYNDALQSLLLVLAGYEHAVEENISKLLSAIDDPELALRQWQQAISAIEARMPSQLLKSLSGIIKKYEKLVLEGVGSDPASTFSARSTPRSLPFPSDEVLNSIDEFIENAPQAEQMQLQITLEPLISVAYIHQGGREAHASRIVRQLLDKFLNVEEIFNTDANLSDIIEDLRHKHKDAPQEVLDIVVSHQALKTKCNLLFGLLSAAIMPNPQKYRTYLRRLVALESKGAEEIALRAKHLLDHSMLADLRSAVARSLSGLEMFHGSDISDAEMEKEKKKKRHHNSMPESELAALIESDFSLESSSRLVRVATKREGLFSGLEKGGETLEQRMRTLVEAQAAVEDPLASLLDHPDSDIQWRAVETYIKRIYSPYLLESSLQLKAAGSGAILATWCYVEPVATAAAAACSMKSDLHFGIMVILQSLSQFPATVTAAAVAVGDAKKYYNCQMPSKNTMHIALVGNGEGVLRLSSNASILFKEMKCRLNRERSFDEDVFSSESDGELLTPGMNFLTSLKSAAASAVAAEASVLKSAGFTTVSFVRPAGKILPQRFGFIWNTDDHAYNLVEQKRRKGLWQVEPPIANLLDLQKLKGLASLYCPSRTKQWHLFVVTEKTGVRTAALRRVFLRGLVRKLEITPENRNNCSKVIESIQPHLTCALEELERAQFDDTSRARSADWAHIYLSVLPSHLPVAGKDLGHAEMAGALRAATAKLVLKCGALLRRTAVSCWETRLVAVDGTAWRICVSLPSGFESDLEHIDIYREALDQSGHAVYAPQPAAGARPGPLAGHLLSKVYEPLETLQRKRLSARRLRTTYCYDFPPLFETALREIWSKASPGSDLSESTKLLEAEEFVLNETALQNGESIWNIDLVPITRPPGQNNVGMIAWIWTIKVPEKPDGRQIVVIANDASHSAGSFGPKEDAVFKAATELGLKRKLPIIYLSVNSGARFGLAEEVRSKFKVAWVNDTDPAKGFQYLYLDDSDYEKVKASIKAEVFVTDHGEKRWIITDVIGAEDGIGVECLSGSGAIATAFSKAYHEGFTLTFVTGRAIGIGAYLARLGHRVVQRVDQPIILTGYAALNKLLGKEVYTSHMQLGGPKVMANNGVTHCLVEDDISGALEILNWLSYVPCNIGGPLSLMKPQDAVDRDVTYYPGKDEKLDPRAAIAGKEKTGESKERLLGMFDDGEFSELQAGWAKTVITGHARLGGIPVGVVAVEVDTVSMNIPADPGDSSSSERNVAQAGQVWFPDSALKTAQAIEEFDLEGLPLFILANWRGFSGGMRDLFDGVLQNGAKIVEALRIYKNPIYIYLPPKCELRGGAWAVLDTKINPERIEMYADCTARGGVLEPEGMVEIKYRDSQLVKTIHRLDPVVQALKREEGNSSLNPSAKHGNESAILARQQALLQPYRSIAVGFADMHDKAERMRAKGIIRKVVPWKDARRFFYWRLRKAVVEDTLAGAIRSAQESMSFKESKKLVSSWYREFNSNASESNMEGPNTDWEQEMQELQKFVTWSESESKKIQSRIETLQAESATRVLKQFMNSDLGPVNALMEAIQQMSQNLQAGEGSISNSSAEAKALNVLKETRDRLQNLMVDDGDA